MKNRFKHEAGRRGVEYIIDADDTYATLRGYFLSRTRDLGLDKLNPGVLSTPAKRRELTRKAQELTERIRQECT